mgnify:CR=1 FL=1
MIILAAVCRQTLETVKCLYDHHAWYAIKGFIRIAEGLNLQKTRHVDTTSSTSAGVHRMAAAAAFIALREM